MTKPGNVGHLGARLPQCVRPNFFLFASVESFLTLHRRRPLHLAVSSRDIAAVAFSLLGSWFSGPLLAYHNAPSTPVMKASTLVSSLFRVPWRDHHLLSTATKETTPASLKTTCISFRRDHRRHILAKIKTIGLGFHLHRRPPLNKTQLHRGAIRIHSRTRPHHQAIRARSGTRLQLSVIRGLYKALHTSSSQLLGNMSMVGIIRTRPTFLRAQEQTTPGL
ncbi:uncharacterized protein J3D65DRAFT_628994 [Phyllosticta citribraziliensis]|uniref:Uncharacterized protein n=1 Tax=Phyllosticta citribraziliensis TaxID=989973 RepID=A0ABR1LHU3_9PEZI